MKLIPTRMTAGQLSAILNITEKTVKKLAETKQLPCLYDNKKIYFDFGEIIKRFKEFEGGAA